MPWVNSHWNVDEIYVPFGKVMIVGRLSENLADTRLQVWPVDIPRPAKVSERQPCGPCNPVAGPVGWRETLRTHTVATLRRHETVLEYRRLRLSSHVAAIWSACLSGGTHNLQRDAQDAC
eukprot:85285-Prorocentrum_minimum.AAC.7